MNWLDITIVIVAVVFTMSSAAWGLLRQVIAIGGLILGIFLAANFNTPVAQWLLTNHFASDSLIARGIAFFLIVIITSVLASALASALFFTVGLLFFGWLDTLGGAILGFLQGVIAVAVVLVGGLLAMPATFKPAIEQSALASRLVRPLGNLVANVAPSPFKEVITAALQTLSLPS